MVSKRLDLSFGIFARRGEKYSYYTLVLKFVPSAGRGCMAQPRVRLVGMQATACSATHVVLGDWGWRA